MALEQESDIKIEVESPTLKSPEDFENPEELYKKLIDSDRKSTRLNSSH